ncbi:MAG: flagellar biosynthetic protein FliR [Candidatus Solibacter sp.]|nr:flagellar biosynthetic protein FliR [Candidatus Solibacter sp.]
MDLLRTAERILATAGIHTDLSTFLALFGLAFARVVTAIYFAPFFGGNSVPSRVRVGLAVILAALLAPNLARTGGAALSPLLLVALLAKEVLVGAMLGVVCQFVFYGIQMAGTLIDTQRGMNQLNYVAPQLAGPTSVLGQLKLQTAIVVFLISNGHLMYLRALDTSFRELGVLTFPRIAPGSMALMETAARLSANALLIGLQMAAPVLISLLMVDVAFGILGRVASQVNVHQESQPVKALAGIGVVLLASGYLMSQLELQLGNMIGAVNQMTRVLRP